MCDVVFPVSDIKYSLKDSFYKVFIYVRTFTYFVWYRQEYLKNCRLVVYLECYTDVYRNSNYAEPINLRTFFFGSFL